MNEHIAQAVVALLSPPINSQVNLLENIVHKIRRLLIDGVTSGSYELSRPLILYVDLEYFSYPIINCIVALKT